MNLVITRAAHDTLNARAPLFDAYRQGYAQASNLRQPRRLFTPSPDPDSDSGPDDSSILPAHNASYAAGFTQLHPLWNSVDMVWIRPLKDRHVMPTARRHGVADALLKADRERGQHSSAQRLAPETDPHNHPLQRPYQGHGWQRQSYLWYGLMP